MLNDFTFYTQMSSVWFRNNILDITKCLQAHSTLFLDELSKRLSTYLRICRYIFIFFILFINSCTVASPSNI